MLKKIAAFFISGVFSFIIAIVFFEIVLRIWKPPYIRVRGNTILLEKNKTNINIYNFASDKIHNNVVVRRNSLGFRGPEPPIDFSTYKTVIAIGGSTTECIFVTEGKTWSDVIYSKLKNHYRNFWINNAGMDGASTFGHIQMLRQYILKLKPDYIALLVGINDMAINRENRYDTFQFTEEISSDNSIWQKIKNNSMVVSYITYKLGIKGQHSITTNSDYIVDFSVPGDTTVVKPVTQTDIDHFVAYIDGYKSRLRTIIDLSRSQSIEPILITQPTVYGFGIDPQTGVDLGEIVVSDFTEPNIPRRGKDKWFLLQMYNNATKEVAKDLGVSVIDLAVEMPKDSKYYYDHIHYTEEGAEMVGEILSRRLIEIIK